MAYSKLFPGMEDFIEENDVGQTSDTSIKYKEITPEVIEQTVAADELQEAEMQLNKLGDLMVYHERLHEYVKTNGFSKELFALCGDDLRLITGCKLSENNLAELNNINSAAYLQAMEGFGESILKFLKSLWAKYTHGVYAALNYFTNWVSTAETLKTKCKLALRETSEVSDNATLTKNQVTEYMKHDICGNLKKTDTIIKRFQESSLTDALALREEFDENTETLSDLDKDIKAASETLDDKDGSTVTTSDRTKLLNYAINQLDQFINAKKNYSGFWELGFSKGLPKFLTQFGVKLVAGALVPIAGALAYTALEFTVFRDWERMAVISWSIIRHAGNAILAFAGKVLRSYK